MQSFTVAGLTGSPTSAKDQRLGSELAAGDVDGDGVGDLVASAPWFDVGGQPRAGAVAVVYGSRDGLDLARSVLITRNTPGIPGAVEAYGYFGTAVSTGDFDGNGTTELAVASRDNGLGLGAVQVLARTSTGFTGPAPIGPDTAGLPSDPGRSATSDPP